MSTPRARLIEAARAAGALRQEDVVVAQGRRDEYRRLGIEVHEADLLAASGLIDTAAWEHAIRGDEVPSRIAGLEVVRLAGGTPERPVFLTRRPVDGETFLVHACMQRRADAPADVDAFLRAAEDGRRVRGESWLPVLEVAGADGAYAAVSAVPDGARLDERLADGRHYPPSLAVTVLRRLAEALWSLEALGRPGAFPDPSLVVVGRDNRPTLCAMEVLLSTKPGPFDAGEFARSAANLLARLVGPERLGDPGVRSLLAELGSGRFEALRPEGLPPRWGTTPTPGTLTVVEPPASGPPTPVTTPPLPPSSMGVPRPKAPAPSRRAAVPWKWLAAAVVAGAGVLWMLKGSDAPRAPREPAPSATAARPSKPSRTTPAPQPVPEATPPETAPRPRPPTDARDPGLLALDEALSYRAAHRIDDPIGVVDRLRAVEARYGGTDAGRRAASERETFLKEVEGEADRAAAAISADVERLLAADEFGAALARVNSFPATLVFTRAVTRVEALRARVKERVEAAYAALRPAIDAAADPGREAEARSALDRAKALGDPEVAQRAEQRFKDARERAASRGARRKELQPALDRAVGEALAAAGLGEAERARRVLEAADRGPLGEVFPDRISAARESADRVAKAFEAAATEWRARSGKTASVGLREYGSKPTSVTPGDFAGDRLSWTRGGMAGGARLGALDPESVADLALGSGRDRDGAAVLAVATFYAACGRLPEAEAARARAEGMGSSAPHFDDEVRCVKAWLAAAASREVAAADAALERDRAEARAGYERAAVTAPFHPLPHRKLAEWLEAEKRQEDALAEWRRAKALGDTSGDVLHGLARACAASGQPEEAVLEAWRAYLATAAPNDPRRTAARAEADRLAMRVVRGSTTEKVKAAQALLAAGKAAEAVAALEEAVAADPSSLDARKALARAAEKAEDVVKSYLAWREAQGIAVSAKDAADCKEQADRLMRQYGERPSQATVRRGAETSAARGEFAAAVETYRRAVAMSPLDVEARLGLGGSLLGLALRTGSKPLFEEGISHYDVAVRVAPEDYRGWIGRGETRRWKGDFDGAISDASAAIARRKDAAQAYNTRGLAFYQALQFESAVADFNVVVTLAPMLATPRISRAGAYLAMGRYDEAEADLTAAEARSPTEGEKQTIASVREQIAARRKADRR